MADADEDLIPRVDPSSTAAVDPSADLEDEAQDFRFLAHLTGSKATNGSALPRRGEKDFEPNPTQAQSTTLALSREAMHDALSVERILPPRNPVVGQYLPDPKDWRWDVRPDYEHGIQGRGGRCVVVEKFSTTYARSMGIADYRNWSWLLPEEALFLIERGTLDIRWPDEKVRSLMKGHAEQDDEAGSENDLAGEEAASDEEGNVETSSDVDAVTKKGKKKFSLHVGDTPLSLQAAFACLIGKSGLTLERYSVYTGLRRLGYIVRRAPTWDEGEVEEGHINGHTSEPDGHTTQAPSSRSMEVAVQPQSSSPNPGLSLVSRLLMYLFPPKPIHYRPSQGPLLYPGLYGNYNDIFRTLSLVPYSNDAKLPSASPSDPPRPSTPRWPYTIAWFVHKPSPNIKFRKSMPPSPDFRVAVLDARVTSVPTAFELGTLLDSMPLDELPREKRMEQRMKHGMRNVVLAIVDSGLVSYLRFGDICSGLNGRVYETKTIRGAKRGGGFKRGGRGGRGGRG